MAVIIVRNTTISSIMIEDLGISIPGSSSINLTDNFSPLEISKSQNLKDNVSNGSLIVSDGTNELSISNGLKQIYFETEWEDEQDVSDGGQLSCIQIRRSTSLALTTSYVDIVFDITDLQNRTTVLEHNNANKSQIFIKQNGLYKIDYNLVVQAGAAGSARIPVYTRIIKNSSTIIPGSESYIDIYQYEGHDIDTTCIVSLESGDILSLQSYKDSTYTVSVTEGATLNIIKLDGIQGEQGIPGSNVITVQNDGTTIVSNAATLNFSGAVVTADGLNKAVIEIPSTVQINICQVYDGSGGTNVNNSTPVAIPFNTNFVVDSFYSHSTISNNTRIYIQQTGLYKISYNVSMQTTANSEREVLLRVRKNGSNSQFIEPSVSYVFMRDSTEKYGTGNASFFAQLTINDYIELVGSQAGSTGSVSLIADASWILLEFIR